MRVLLIFACCILFSISSFCQTINITQVVATTVSNGINIRVIAISYNGAGYLSHNYSIVGNEINLAVCYWFNNTLPVMSFQNDFFIPIVTPGEYNITVAGRNSSSNITCNNFTTTSIATARIGYLSNPQFEKPKVLVSPNPFSEYFDIETEQAISKYSIMDITGKILVATSSKSELYSRSSFLSAGLYVLNLEFDDGQKANFKIVKK